MQQEFSRKAAPPEGSADVIIIGAGITGLTTALKLLDRADQQGLPRPQITILEGDDRPGGRVKSLQHSNGHFVDSGAHWFHDGPDNPFYKWYCDRYGALEVNNDSLEHRTIIAADGVHDMEYRKGIEAALYAKFQELKESEPDKIVTLDELVRVTDFPGVADFAEYITRNWFALESPKQVSCDDLYGDTAGPAPGGLQVRTGMETIIGKMVDELKAKGVVIKTGEPIASVNQTADGATVTATDGHIYDAAEVISTVSVGVLQRGLIQVTPEPSQEVTEYVDSIIMGKMTKVIVPMTEEFFEKNNIPPNSHFYVMGTKPPVFCHTRPDSAPFIDILVGGREAEALEKQPPEVISAFIDDIFGKVDAFRGYESNIAGQPLVTGWASNPLYFGAYSSCSPGAKRQGPIRDGRITYAGEAFAPTDETGVDQSCTMAGAWYSGQLCGDQVFEKLQYALAARQKTQSVIVPKVGKIAILDRNVLHVVDADDPASVALLTRAYNEVYLPAIKFANERESLDEWLAAMRGQARSPDPSIAVLVGDFSNGLENSTIKGVAIADYQIKSGIGTLAYNTVAPEYRGEGLGRVLLDARVELLKEMAQAYGRELKAVFFEINDPRKIASGQDSIDPAKRMSIYTKMGAFPVPIDYIQPPLAGSGQKCRNLLLMALPLTGKVMPDRGTVAEFLDGIYEATIGAGYESDPDLRAMKEQLFSPEFDMARSIFVPPRPDPGPDACPR